MVKKENNIKKQTVFPVSLGCSKNQVDLENILSEFVQSKFDLSENIDEAEYIIINTCGFIDSAKEESIDTILDICQASSPEQKIIVSGCLSQRYAEQLPREMPEVDFWTGNYAQGKILKLIGHAKLKDLCPREDMRRVRLGNTPHHAYLKIAEGCNRSCSFCAIPSIRGKQKSVDIADLVAEAQYLHQNGVQELSLIAQDLTYYGREKSANYDLETLLRSLLEYTDIPWIRLMYAYPAFINDSLLQLIAENPRICKYLDMPIQHASTNMLQQMRRNYTGPELRSLLRKIRQQVPDIALRSTVLVGFPGETEADFQELVELIEEVRFDRLGAFAFSPEEGTHASTLKLPPVSVDLAMERYNIINERQNYISLERNQNLIGSEMTIIIDEVAEESEFHYYGRSQWDALEVDNVVRLLDGSAQVGDFVRVRVVDASAHDLDATFF
ncbi:MAG: 30S ribosomal protein S12 methylthiotransferase RimO [Fibrobacter sp.]|nr:30S ribosomal protein S12 methylthiotransferase RimO [Fibrobacter sp.]